MPAWDYTPTFVYRLRQSAPQVLTSEFEDGGLVIREKAWNTAGRVFVESHSVNGTDMGAMLDFFNSFGLADEFDKYTFDPADATNATVNVRFVRMFDFEQVAHNRYHTTIEFREDV